VDAESVSIKDYVKRQHGGKPNRIEKVSRNKKPTEPCEESEQAHLNLLRQEVFSGSSFLYQTKRKKLI